MTGIPKMTLSEEKIDTDVLVVGAGAGGMMAAISAAECGAKVTLCEKGNARRSGGLHGGNDHFMCYIPGIHTPDLREKYIRISLSRGMGDEEMIRKRIDLTYEVVKKWEDYGIHMKTNGHYEFVGHGWPGSSGRMGEPGKTSRMFLHFSDSAASKKLEKQARNKGVRIINRVMVNELLKDSSGRAIGAVGISTREPKIYIIRFKTIVFNQGKVDRDRLYASPHTISYGMAMPGTGDGIMMAYRAGADLKNAEVCRRQVAQRFGPPVGKGTWIGVTRDNDGNPIAPPYLKEPDLEIGDMAIENPDALDHIWETGKGPAWMDVRGISQEDEEYMRWGFESEGMKPFFNWLDQEEKVDVKKSRFEFVALQPETGIQIKIDTNYRATLEGVYAILRGNLPVNAVGGMVAGETAAKEAQNSDLSDLASNNDKISNLKQSYEQILSREGLHYSDWREAQWAINQTMHCYALPPKRTEGTLMAGHHQILKIRDKAKKLLKATNQNELCHCLEVLNLLDIAELVLIAVKERKESRGQARRQDYPFPNPMLDNKSLVISKVDGKPALKWE